MRSKKLAALGAGILLALSGCGDDGFEESDGAPAGQNKWTHEANKICQDKGGIHAYAYGESYDAVVCAGDKKAYPIEP